MTSSRLNKLCRLTMGEVIVARDCTGEGLPIFSADTGDAPWAHSTHTRRHLSRGTIVVGARGSIGNPRLPKAERFSATQTTIVLEPYPEADVASEFLLYALRMVRWSDLALQQAVPMLTVAALGELDVPNPPKPEQEKIAEVLMVFDCLVEQTEALLAKQRRIKAGLTHDLLTRGLDEKGRLRDPSTHRFKPSQIGQIPEDWTVRPLAEVVPPKRQIVYGILMPGDYVEGGVPVIKVKDIQEGMILRNGLLRTDPSIDAAYARSRLKTGDLLFTIRGSVGRMAVVPAELEGANITQDTARITVGEGSTTFIRHCLEMPPQRALIELHTIGQAVNGINLSELRKIPVQFPEPDEQEEIASRLDAKDRDLAATSEHLAKLRRVQAGLMQDLLTGRVPVTPLLAERTAATSNT